MTTRHRSVRWKKRRSTPVPGVADAKPALTADEGEGSPELEEKLFEPEDERLLEVGLGVLVPQSEELEDERVLQLLLRRDRVGGLLPTSLLEHRCLVPR
jgi:hypothetical protein